VFICATPTLYSNCYGNALYSILKLLSSCILILTETKTLQTFEAYAWPLFAHPVLLLLVPIQIIINVLTFLKPKQKQVETQKRKTKEEFIIGSNDVPFLFNRV
jgi:hypothetical protein